MTMGVKFFSNTIGKEFMMDEGCRYMNYLGRVTNNAMWVTIPRKPTAGSTIYFILENGANELATTNIDRIATFYDVKLSDDRQSVQYGIANMGAGLIYGNVSPYDRKYPEMSFPLHIFEIGGASPTAGFGFGIYGGSDYNIIVDGRTAGACVWKYSGKVKSGFAIPTSIPAYNNSIVYARWNLQTHGIKLSSDKKIAIYTDQSANVDTTTELDMQLVVFSSGFDIPETSIGINVRNEANQITFSSDYPPLRLRGTMHYPKWNGTSWPGTFDVADLPIADGMVPLVRSYGTFIRPTTIDNIDNRFRHVVLNAACRMYDNKIQVFQGGEVMVSGIPLGQAWVPTVTGSVVILPIPVISASDYF